MAELGAKRIMDYDTFIAWSTGKGKPGIRACAAAQQEAGDRRQRLDGRIPRSAKPEQVDALYKKAMALGGPTKGLPGDRGDNYYGAYFRDLDGNKLNFHCWT